MTDASAAPQPDPDRDEGVDGGSQPRPDHRPDLGPAHGRPQRDQDRALWRAGRTAWSVLGIAGVVVAAGYALSVVSLVVVPVVLALFPATLLVPLSDALRRRGLRPALAALVAVLTALVLIFGVIGGAAALVVSELPELTESAAEGLDRIGAWLEDDPLGIGVRGISDAASYGREQLGEAGDLAGQALSAASVVFELVAGTLLMAVVLFLYLKDGRRLRDAVVATTPQRRRPLVSAGLDQAWTTLASYVRGQLIVAAVDAVFIGIGLLILGVPLALPLAILVLFGGLFPIVGAVTTGALAVLVGLADGGLVVGLIVLAIVLVVQQLEGNVLEPLILGRTIHLHPLVVLVSITAGAATLGILGAFLAVPVVAIVARIVDLLRAQRPTAGPATSEAQ